MMRNNEYEAEIRKLIRDGFFDDCEIDPVFLHGTNLNLERITELFACLRGRKYALKYLMTGRMLMPSMGVSSKYLKPEESEKVYKHALESGQTWEECIGYKEPPKGVLL